MLLRTTKCPHSGRHNLNAWQERSFPVIVYVLSFHVSFHSYHVRVHRHGGIAHAKQNALGLQVVDADSHRTNAGHYEVAFLGLPERIAFHVPFFVISSFEGTAQFGGMKHLVKIVLSPGLVVESIRDGVMAENHHYSQVGWWSSRGLIGHHKNCRPGKWKDLVRPRGIEHNAVFSFQLVEPGIWIIIALRMISNGLGARGNRRKGSCT